MSEHDCLNNEDQLDSVLDEVVQIDSDFDSVDDIDSDLEKVVEIVRRVGPDIKSISVNGEALTPDENKNVNIVVAEKTSDLLNDGDGTSPFATEQFVKDHVPDVDFSEVEQKITDVQTNLDNLSNSLSEVATSGSYNDLKDKPEVPSIEGLASETYVDSAVADKATKDFVNSSISTNTATFRGTFNSLSELNNVTGMDENDYAFVISKDDAGNTLYGRYKYASGIWTFEYNLNNSSFTAEQWATINSGVTASQIQTITTNISNLKTKDSELASSIIENASLIQDVSNSLEQKANLSDLDDYVSMESLSNYLPTVKRLI